MTGHILSSKWIFRAEKNGGCLYNPRTQDFLVVNESARDILLTIEDTCLSPEEIHTILSAIYDNSIPINQIKHLINELFSRGIIQLCSLGEFQKNYTEIVDKIKQTISLLQQSKAPFVAPTSMDIYPTMLCNFSCSFCYVGDNARRQFEKYTMSFDTFKRIVDEASKEKVFYLSILGGEPLLVPWLEDAIDYAKHKRIRLEIVSNGYLITRSIVEKLADNPYAHINISLHGVPNIHDSLVGFPNAMKQILKNLDLLKEYGVSFGIGYTVTSLNSDLRNIEYVIEIAKRYNVKYISLRLFQAMGRGYSSKEFRVSPCELFKLREVVQNQNKDLTIYLLGAFAFLYYNTPIPSHPLNKERIRYCGAGVRKLDILPNGDVTPCILLWELDPENYTVGNICETPLRKIWQVEDGILTYLRSRKAPVECHGCQYNEICRGGCPAHSLAEHGTMNKRDPYCLKLDKNCKESNKYHGWDK
ncbi:radical SAM protein [Thermococcus sp.]